MKKAFIIYCSKESNGKETYRVMGCNITRGDNGALVWKYVPMLRTENNIHDMMGSIVNAVISNGKVKGEPASLDRYRKEGVVTILSQIETYDGAIKGYKVCNTAGKVSNIPVGKLCEACRKYLKKTGESLLTNGIFVDATSDKKAHIKPYIEGQYIVEKVNVGVAKAVATVKREEVKKNVDIEKESKLESIFSKEQIEQLILGKKAGLNIRVYANPELSAEQMCELRKAMERGIDVTLVAKPAYGIMEMKTYIMDIKDGLDIRPYLSSQYSAEQISELSLAAELGLDISKMSDPRLTPNEMTNIRERLENEFWREEFSMPASLWENKQ